MKPLFLLCALALTATGFGQKTKFTFKLGTEYELPRRTADLAFFGNEKDGIVNLSLKKEELNIIRFNTSNLNKTSEKVIELKEATRNFLSEMVADFNTGDYYWIHSDWDKDGGTEMLYYDKIDVTTGKITEANHKILQTTKIGGRYAGFAVFGSPMAPGADGYFGTGYKTTEKYQYDYDAENKKLLITYRLVPEKKRDKENFDVIGFHVFDEKMNKLWGGEFRMPYNEAIMDNSNFSVDSKGNAYMLAKVYDSESRRERDKSTDKPAYHFEVMKFTKDSKTPIIAKLSVGDFYIHETTITENTLHDMIIACTYSKKSKGTGTDGIFLATLDQAGKLIQFKNGYYEFPKEELQKFESARARRRIDRKDDYEAPNLKVRDVQVEADGSIFLACEEYRVVEHTSGSGMNGNRMSTYYTYHYEDIIGSRIDPAGKFQWVRKIPKMQRGRSGRGTMGFKLVSDASGYYFLYLDNLKNLDIAEDEPPKTHVDGYGGQVMVSRLTMDGKLSKELLFDTREEDIMIFPADFHKISGNRFIGRARLKRNLFQPLLITTK